VRMPAGLMAVVGSVADGVAVLLGAVGVKLQPTFTRSRVQYLTTHHYYSIEKVGAGTTGLARREALS
jgi:hypothetical protein